MATVETLITRIRRRLEDPNGLHWPDTEIIGSINESKQDLFDYIFNRNRDVFDLEAVEFEWPADKMSLSLASIIPKTLGSYDIILITMTPRTDATSVNNLPTPLSRVNYEELYRHSTSTPLFYDAFQDEAGNIESWSGGVPVLRTMVRWAQQGHTMHLDPVPRTKMKLRFQVVNRWRQFDEGGSDKTTTDVFPGGEVYFGRWERLVEYMATVVLKGRSEENEQPLILQLRSKFSLLDAWLDAKSGGGTPRVVVNAY